MVNQVRHDGGRFRRIRSVLFFTGILLVAGVLPSGFAQAIAPVPLPPPPLSEEAMARVMECTRLQQLLQQMTSDDMDEREQAQREARGIVTRERMRLLQQAIVVSEIRGEIPGPPREEVDRRLQDLLKDSCVYQILMGGLKHPDGEVRARAQMLLDRLDPPSRRPRGESMDEHRNAPDRDAPRSGNNNNR